MLAPGCLPLEFSLDCSTCKQDGKCCCDSGKPEQHLYWMHYPNSCKQNQNNQEIVGLIVQQIVDNSVDDSCWVFEVGNQFQFQKRNQQVLSAHLVLHFGAVNGFFLPVQCQLGLLPFLVMKGEAVLQQMATSADVSLQHDHDLLLRV